MSIDKFFNRTYERNHYNCAHFVCEVWKDLTGQDISGSMSGFLVPMKERHALPTLRRYFERLEGPRSPCIVLMQRPRYAPHVGIYLRGRVLHIQEHGVEFQPIDVATIGFTQIGYYNVKNSRSSS